MRVASPLVEFTCWEDFSKRRILSLALLLLVHITVTAGGDIQPITDENIHNAVRAWCFNSSTANTTYGPISSWDVSTVRNMSKLFVGDNTSPHYVPGAEFFNDDISGWQTSSVEDMSYMFYHASMFDQNIGSWDTSLVRTMANMFCFSSSFNQAIDSWDTHRVIDMDCKCWCIESNSDL